MITGKHMPGSRASHIRWRKMLQRVGFYVLAIGAMMPFVVPFVWMLMNSVKNERDILAIPPKFIFVPTLDNFIKILSTRELPQYFLNSTVIAAASTVLALLLGLPAAFAIARYKRNRLATATLLARILPQVSVLLPWFVAIFLLGLNDTYPAMILTHMVVALPLTIWIMIPFFEDLPGELLDAASIDGCSLRMSFLRVALPLTLPGIAVATILCFVGSWNQFMLSMVVSGPRTMTLPLLAYSQIAFDYIYFGAMAASGIILTLPVLILTMFVQRYLVAGLSLGSTAG